MSNLLLFHGTSVRNAGKILSEGFQRAKKGSYTGTGVNLSECITVSYEYGEYENRGCVLQVSLHPDAKWENLDLRASLGMSLDKYFEQTGLDAVSTFGGNVWVVWNPEVITDIRKLDHTEAVALLLARFQEDGPNCGYNGVAGDYSELFWGEALRRGSALNDPAWRAKLESTLAKARTKLHRPVSTGHHHGMASAIP